VTDQRFEVPTIKIVGAGFDIFTGQKRLKRRANLLSLDRLAGADLAGKSPHSVPTPQTAAKRPGSYHVSPTTTCMDPPSTGDLRRRGALLTTGWACSFGSPNNRQTQLARSASAHDGTLSVTVGEKRTSLITNAATTPREPHVNDAVGNLLPCEFPKRMKMGERSESMTRSGHPRSLGRAGYSGFGPPLRTRLSLRPSRCYWGFAFAFAHRTKTALRALSLRSSGVILAARAGPPFLPPLRPKATAAGFFLLFATPVVYGSGRACAKSLAGLKLRERSRIME
jgi:hypothetical protein